MAGGLRPRLPAGVWAAAGVVVAVELVVSARYGYHRDELYFLAAGRRLEWGFVDQPPATPALARLSDELFGGALPGLRLWPALAAAAVVVVVSAIARELGGERRAQVIAAVATAASTFLLLVGHLLSTTTFDLLLWLVVLLLVTRLLRTGDPRWWLAIGAVFGVGLLNKFLVGLLAVGLGVGLLAGGRAQLLRTGWLAAGVSLAAAIAAPTLVWQATHGWPQLELVRSVSDDVGGPGGAVLQLALLVVAFNPVLAALWVQGAGTLFRSHQHRTLAWIWVTVLIVTVAVGGKLYYPVALFYVLLAAGAVAWEQRWRQRPRRLHALTVGLAVSGVVLAPIALPLLPVSTLSTVPVHAANAELAETIGWPELVEEVDRIYRSLTPAEQRRTAIFTGSYGEAGAIEQLGIERGLPQPVSGHNSYWWWGPPDPSTTTVIAVRANPSDLAAVFEHVEPVGSFSTPHGVDNQINGIELHLARGPRLPWNAIWPLARHYD